MKVLVVDDEAAIRELLELILVTEGHAVALARDGVEGLAAVDAVAPDIILLDLKMPVMDGREFVERYRAHEGKKAPIVVISAVQKLSEYADLGACAVLAKPFELQTLLDAIAQCTGHKVGSAASAPA